MLPTVEVSENSIVCAKTALFWVHAVDSRGLDFIVLRKWALAGCHTVVAICATVLGFDFANLCDCQESQKSPLLAKPARSGAPSHYYFTALNVISSDLLFVCSFHSAKRVA